MTPLPTVLAVVTLMAGASAAQYAGNLAFLAWFAVDSSVRTSAQVAECIALVIFASLGAALGRKAYAGLTARQRLRQLVGAEEALAIPEPPDIETRLPHLLAAAGVIVAWWTLYALSPLVLPLRLFVEHWGWLTIVNVASPFLLGTAILLEVEPLIARVPEGKPARTG